MKVLTSADVLASYSKFVIQRSRPYFAMYSSVAGGIVTDPALMWIPLDDHMVHRGDGVFEALKCVDGALYDADAHLNRLERSAAGISLVLPSALAEIKATLLETIKASGQRSGTLRIFVSRGPGDFSPNPYSTTGSQLYIVYTASAPYAPHLYSEGATLGLSQHQAKPRPFCSIKSCNYLPNVLMKKEAVDRGLDFVIASTADGEITESSTENVALVTRDGMLVAPPYADMLRGTTLERVLALTQANTAILGLRGAEQRPLRVQDFENAQTALIIGTTMTIMPAKSFEKISYTPVADLAWLPKLSALFKADVQENAARRTVVDFA